MASIAGEKNGRRTIQLVGDGSRRRSIRLGKMSQRHAEAVKFRVEQLVTAANTGHAVDGETARWLSTISDDLYDRLARTGLVPMRERATLGPFLDRYFSMRTDVKPTTKVVWENTRRNLVKFFGADRTTRRKSLTPAQTQSGGCSFPSPDTVVCAPPAKV